ncbi:MAG: polysaccharide biosynthesis tyrosine autokinase [Pirellulaceae bacterium]
MNVERHDATLDASSVAAADTIQATLRFCRVLRYRKSYLIMSLAVASLLGAYYYFTATRIYRASASLLVSQTGNDTWNTSMASGGGMDTFVLTNAKLLSSAVVLEGASNELATLPPRMRVDLEGIAREDWLDALRTNLSAQVVRRTNVIELTYRSKTAEAAAAVVEAIVKSYQKFVEETHKDVSIELVAILDAERQKTAEKLELSQKRLLEIKQQAGIVIREGADIVHPIVQRVIELNKTLLEVQQNRLQLEASLAALHAAIHRGGDLREHLVAVDPTVGRELLLTALGINPQFAEVAGEVERGLLDDHARLQSLQRHFGPTHHQIVQLEQRIQNSQRYLAEYQANVSGRLAQIQQQQLGPMLVSMVQEKLSKTQEHERRLGEHYAQAESEALQLNDCMAELQVADNEEQRLRNLHDTLLERMANIDVKQNRADVQVSIISEPRSGSKPVSPRLSLVALLCTIGGFGVGVAIVYIQDLLDDRFRSPEELKEQLGAPLLAMIRRLPAHSGFGIDSLHVHVNPSSVETEAFRTLRTTLAFSGQEVQQLAITSSESGDGKTTLLANLGVTYAQAGKRTLLIDADMRKPGLTRLFDMRGLGGLSEILRSDERCADMCRDRVRSAGTERLDLLPCGPKPSDPAELLSGARLADLLAWAGLHYDQVLVDCPPVTAVTDAMLVGRLVDGMVLVVQPEKNHRRLVLRAVESLSSVQIKLVGIVANRVGDEKDAGYYGYGYGYDYGHEEDQATPAEERGSGMPNSEVSDVDGLQLPRRAA